MTVDYVPFINTVKDCVIANAFYSDAVAYRVSLEKIKKTSPHLPNGPKRWLDPAIDGLHQRDLSRLTEDYSSHVKKFPGFDQIANPTFQSSPNKATVQKFVSTALSLCKEHAPNWISIPQLPIVNDSSRNKINKMMAECSKVWKQTSEFSGKLVLPAIFTHQQQITKKTERTKKIAAIIATFQAGEADGVWVVDSSLSDQDASQNFDNRFSKLRSLQEELNEKIPEETIIVAGPYWGVNLVLWTRGLTKFAGIGLGNSYKYNIPGTPIQQGKMRVALTPLRRWSVASPELRNWLANTAKLLAKRGDHQAAGEFLSIEKQFHNLQSSSSASRSQIARFYRDWFHKFWALPSPGRALALYNDLSSSYVLGRSLDDLPEEGTARKPYRVQQQLMMNCL